VGAPNAGKSTLINLLTKREVALTSEQPGTTRDVLEVRMDLGGLAVTFLDMAGVRESENEIEAAGIERAKVRARAADLRLYLDDSARVHGLPVEAGDLLLHGKCDLGSGPGLNVSGKTGEGLDEMLAAVREELEQRAAGSGLATRDRHRLALVAAAQHAEAALGRLGSPEIELVADDLRAARHELDVLVGRVDVEEILGHIFSSFCIGK
jgi:tRNA modification GTPase